MNFNIVLICVAFVAFASAAPNHVEITEYHNFPVPEPQMMGPFRPILRRDVPIYPAQENYKNNVNAASPSEHRVKRQMMGGMGGAGAGASASAGAMGGGMGFGGFPMMGGMFPFMG